MDFVREHWKGLFTSHFSLVKRSNLFVGEANPSPFFYGCIKFTFAKKFDLSLGEVKST